MAGILSNLVSILGSPGRREISSYGLNHPYNANGGPWAGLPMFEGGAQFNAITLMNIGAAVGTDSYAGAQFLGHLQSLQSAAGTALYGTTAGTPTPGLEIATAAAADAYYSLRSNMSLCAHHSVANREFIIGGFARMAISGTLGAADKFGFGLVPAATARLADTAVPASGSIACGVYMTTTGFSGVCQGATAGGGTGTVLGTFAALGIEADKYFDVGFNARFSATASRCNGSWWVNGKRFAVPAANLATMITGANAKAVISAISHAGAATTLRILGAKVMARHLANVA